jgi:ribose 5-phosphate isomerase B
MQILIASDHAGFELKEKLKPFLKEMGYEVVDKGAFELNLEDDYPDFVIPLAETISANARTYADKTRTDAEGDKEKMLGIILGGSGQGEAICANRFSNVRAVVFNGQYKPEDGREVPQEIVLSREHNDANILSLGARFLNELEAKEAVKIWLQTKFSNDPRHIRRIGKIDAR